ncbi:MAG: hypothetical protein COA79_08160 [Planctomycetota bacterium]|nr:MAG: hypothetical protein COA79_08160 [Planctomycetota bacterium]
MDIKYLELGLIGLSSTLDSEDPIGTARGWFSGHWPCAIIAAYYFCRDNPIEKGVDELISKQADQVISKYSNLFSVQNAEKNINGENKTYEDILEVLKDSLSRYMNSGHNVIFGTYALKVISENKDLASPSILNGIFKLIDYFKYKPGGVDPVKFFTNENNSVLKYNDDQCLIKYIFSSLEHGQRLEEHNRILFDGHAMTHGHALTLLTNLGHGSITKLGYDAHRVHLAENRKVQLKNLVNKELTKNISFDHPFTKAFWERDFQQYDRQWEYGHTFKYLFTFYDLVNQIKELKNKRILEQQLAYLI